MKFKIKYQRTMFSGIWVVTYGSNSVYFVESIGAQEYVRKKSKRILKESAAFARLQGIAVNLLSHEEFELVQKLKKTKCAGISPKQYGWLAGIYERQKRAW